MKKDYINDINQNAERRFFTHNIQLRSDDANSRTIVGYAAVFNRDSLDMGGWIERIAPGAFDDVLSNDCFALFNHEPNMVLARNNSTLKLSVDNVGLRYEFDAPNTTAGNDLLENIRLKNITQSSFGFTIKSQSWTKADAKDQPSVRTIQKVAQLYDVSPVTYPAYPDTSVAARSFKQEIGILSEEEQKEKDKQVATRYLEILKKKNQLRKLTLDFAA